MYSPQYVYIRFCSRNLTCRLYKTEKKKKNNEAILILIYTYFTTIMTMLVRNPLNLLHNTGSDINMTENESL